MHSQAQTHTHTQYNLWPDQRLLFYACDSHVHDCAPIVGVNPSEQTVNRVCMSVCLYATEVGCSWGGTIALTSDTQPSYFNLLNFNSTKNV